MNGETGGASMIARIKAILMTPRAEWPVIARETGPTGDIFTRYVMPLAAIGPVAALIGTSHGIGFALVSYAIGLVMVLVMTFVVEQLAPKFGGEQSRSAAFRLIAYSGTAGWLAGIFNLVPGLRWLGILGLYGIYLFHLGSGPMLAIPPERRVVFIVTIGIVGFIIAMVIALPLTAMIGMGRMAGM